jgi:DNA phosphorothioation-associated putative methyltransferase
MQMLAQIARHRTAIRRTDLSRPIRTALEDQLIRDTTTVLDYGCGQGDDVRNLATLGVTCIGWDPQYCPNTTMCTSDVVNLGYVVNVIEDAQERASVLRSAWEYAKETLIVSARVDGDPDPRSDSSFRDGHLTRISTFQKYFEQHELRDWIESTLGYAPVAAAPGVLGPITL